MQQQTRPEGCPLFRHATGQWAKKIKGKIRYFGTDLVEALARYEASKDSLCHKSKETTAAAVSELTVVGLVNRFLTRKKMLSLGTALLG